MTPTTLSIVDALKVAESFRTRRERFADEDETTALVVVLLNFGDHLTNVACVAGEWSGTKGDLTPTPGRPPMCPNGHVLMEGATQVRLGLVPANL